MTAGQEFDQFLIPEDAKERRAVGILNPITENLSIMRTFMAPSMVRVIENNLKNGHTDLRFFEIANVYLPKSLPLTEAPREVKTLCLGYTGSEEDFFTMKETLEALAADNDLTFTYKKGNVPYLHPGRTAFVYCDGTFIGTFGQLRYDVVDSLAIAKDRKADTKIFLAELDYDALCTKFKDGIHYVPESPYAKISRDISLIVDKKVECGDIIGKICQADALVSKVQLFDIFESEKLGIAKKSMAFNIELASREMDVTDEMTDAAIQRIVELLGEEYGALMRS